MIFPLVVTLTWAAQANAYVSPTHIFSIDDIMGGFDGSTFGSAGVIQDNTILCDAPGSPSCPPGAPSKFEDKNGDTLYPIDSEFGFEVQDFLGAAQKKRDNDYQEGFAGNIEEQGDVVGLKISNAATSTYKVPPPLGTWCQGLGATSVKCSTEHYTVMEHVLTCYETVPYFFADHDSPYTQGPFCEALNNDLKKPDETPIVTDQDLYGLPPNDNTNLVDIAFSTDYSLTKKDDGKVLYRWGSLIKRPTDIRLYAKLELPEEWKKRDDATGELENDFVVYKAYLIINHWITNNPNDQLRAEDMENEGATGRKPGYTEYVDGSRESNIKCYEGDGDYIGVEESTGDPTEIPQGTLFKHPDDDFVLQGDPAAWSEDLQDFFTNAWYTTTDRDPFEWSYRKKDSDVDDPDVPRVVEYLGTPAPLTELEEESNNVELVSGPRWRLKANKFGQDIPGLEIPIKNCEPPPYQNDMIKYKVGEPTTTVIDLLDWDGDSPLATSKGWVDVYENFAVVDNIKEVINDTPITYNGLPMTEDFDLAVYIKGDRKPTALFSARLEISYEGEVPPADNFADFEIIEYGYKEATPTLGEDLTIYWIIKNNGPKGSLGTTNANCNDNRGGKYPINEVPKSLSLEPGQEIEVKGVLLPSGDKPLKVQCTLTTSVTSDGISDPDLENNKITAKDFKIVVKK